VTITSAPVDFVADAEMKREEEGSVAFVQKRLRQLSTLAPVVAAALELKDSLWVVVVVVVVVVGVMNGFNGRLWSTCCGSARLWQFFFSFDLSSFLHVKWRPRLLVFGYMDCHLCHHIVRIIAYCLKEHIILRRWRPWQAHLPFFPRWEAGKKTGKKKAKKKWGTQLYSYIVAHPQ
jgi:hypothetical protein